MFNSLRHSGARPGDIVAVEGIGGLGHLGIQYANRMGFVTMVVGRSKDKEPLAIKLGAKHYIDSGSRAPAEELQKLGGARVVLATAPDARSMSALVGGLSANGKLLIIAAAMEPLVINALDLIARRRSIQGWPSGTAKAGSYLRCRGSFNPLQRLICNVPGNCGLAQEELERVKANIAQELRQISLAR